MTAYLVAPGGNDSTGDGSYAAPFATVAHAASVAVASPVDAIEIAGGTVTEKVPITNTSGFRILRGRGADVSVLAVNIAGSWLSFNSSTEPQLLPIGLHNL